MNHVFVDGNKRVALRAADVFLALNGLDLMLTEDEAVRTTLALTAHETNRDELAQRIARSIVPLL
jgi:death-on-curing protein